MKKNLNMIRGDTLSFGVEFTGMDQDLDSAYFTVKKSYDGDIIFQKSIDDGITKEEDYKYRVRVAPADTYDIEAGQYYYDFEININSDTYTLLIGVLNVAEDVTRAVV